MTSLYAPVSSPSRTSLAAKRWRSVFSHIARLSEAAPANQALRCHVDASLGRPPHHSWKRRPDNNWLEHIRQDSVTSAADLWRRAIQRRHRATLRPSWLRDDDDDDDDDVRQL